MERTDSYLICSTPRTGSTLLCGLLQSTRVAGRPESYFREPDEQLWASRWGIVCSADGTFSYTDYMRAALAAGRIENGVFAARVMWGSMDYLVDKLGLIYPELAGAALDLLNRAFGQMRFVYLQRGDVLAQAVSWLRAEQTNVWHDTDQSKSTQPTQEPHFDFDQIHQLIQVINEHNAAWREWFASVGAQPHAVQYEDLDNDPISVTRQVLDSLGIELPPDREIVVRHRRLADELNVRWIDQYRAALVDRLA